jgi:DNA polymerase-1
VECACVPAMAWLSNAGVKLDPQAWSALIRAAEADVLRLEGELNAAAPPSDQGNLFGGSEWKWSSPAQVLEVFKRAGVALENTEDETLAGVDHPLAALLRDHRGASKKVSAYGWKWLEMLEDGRIFASWRQSKADTGRMTCDNPNMQQVPREKAYRACIVAPEGRVLVKADYSQIELRIAARISGDKRMLAAYDAGEDLHTLTARLILGKDEVTKDDRQIAKSLNFGLLFGMQPPSLRIYARTNYGVEMTPQQAAHYRENWLRTYPGIAAWHRRTKQQWKPESRTLGGRRRIFNNETPLTWRLNSPVQGTGADGLKRALALLWERRAECPGAVPVIVCHDELVSECDRDQAEAVAAWMVAAMKDGMSPLIAPVPVDVEPQIARTWAG